MSKTNFPYHFLAIEGNIGAGKTTLTNMVAERFDLKLILEEFSDNPFLPFFYENPARYAFPVELFFMTERHKQLEAELSQPDLFGSGTVSDYFFLKTLLFAKNNLKEEEYRLFQRLFHILNARFPKPELLVYLHCSVDRLMANIKKRGRGFEKNMDPNYLQQIEHAYFDFFKITTDIPVLVIDVTEADFVANENQLDEIVALLHKTYSVGMHQVKI